MVPSAHTLHYSGILNARQTGLKLDLWCKIPLLVRSGHTEPTPACSDGSSELQLDEHVHKDVHKLFGALGCSCMGLRTDRLRVCEGSDEHGWYRGYSDDLEPVKSQCKQLVISPNASISGAFGLRIHCLQ